MIFKRCVTNQGFLFVCLIILFHLRNDKEKRMDIFNYGCLWSCKLVS